MACARDCGKSLRAIPAVTFDGKAVCRVAVNAHRFQPALAAREKVGKVIAIKAVHGVAPFGLKMQTMDKTARIAVKRAKERFTVGPLSNVFSSVRAV